MSAAFAQLCCEAGCVRPYRTIPDELEILVCSLNLDPGQMRVFGYTVPIHGIEIALHVDAKKVASVRTVTGQTVAWKQSGSQLDLGIDKLCAYEVFLIDF